MGAPARDEMPLLCELGWHKPDPLARWNAGYYFTTCGRCGHDLVRTAYGGWRVPKGFRIVWQSKPPESAAAAELVPDEPPHANDDQMELPIQEVLRHLEAEEQEAAAAPEHSPWQEAEAPQDTDLIEDDFREEEPLEDALPEEDQAEEPALPEFEQEPEASLEADLEPETEPEEDSELQPDADPDSEPELEPEPATPAARAAAVDDFMEDDWFMNDKPGYDDWDQAAEYPAEPAEPVIEDDEKDRVGNRSGKIRYGQEVAAVVAAPATFINMLRSRGDDQPGILAEEAQSEPQPAMAPQAAAPTSNRRVAATLVASFGVLTLIAALGSAGWEIRRTEAATPSPVVAQPDQLQGQPETPQDQAAQVRLTTPEERGFVTASLLNCRSAPAEQAEPVRILPRGESVRILALEPAWASISHEGRQCWASTRYLSAAEPL